MSDLPNPRDLLPHRPPFVFIDEVVEISDVSVVARRTFRPEEDFFRGHFPDNPIVPGVLLIEGMAQTFATLMMNLHQTAGVYLTGIDKARFRKPVLPGDLVEFRVSIVGERLGLVRAKAEALVGGTKVADARLTGRASEA